MEGTLEDGLLTLDEENALAGTWTTSASPTSN